MSLIERREAGQRLSLAVRREIRFGLETLRYWSSTSSSLTKLLLISDLEAYTSETQLDPFFANRDELRKKCGLVFRHRRLNRVLVDPAKALSGFDLIGVKLGFRTDPEQAYEIVSLLSSLKGNAKLIYFDGDDDSTILWPSLVPLVDLYLKKHMFKDPAQYGRTFIGRSNLTDYVARTCGVSFADDMTPHSKPVDSRYLDRIRLGYNLALDEKIVELHRRTHNVWRRTDRPNDVMCRAQLSGWLAYLRRDIDPQLSKLPAKYRYVSPKERVDQRQYDEEMHSSKICVSPFGYGELCWRDFEAVLWGCLLVKPDMSHIRTKPDIFIPNETYVPVKWDLSDLAEKCTYYLEHPEERSRITDNAYRVLDQYYKSGAFLVEVRDILHQLDIDTSMPRN